MVTPRKTQI